MPVSPPAHNPSVTGLGLHRDRLTRQQRGYDNAWLRLSRHCLLEEPMCRYCAERGIVKIADLSDHIIPVRVRPDLRLVRSNIQSLCHQCHNGIKRREERGYSQDS